MKVRKITVITPCYNAAKYIRTTISSVIHQKALIDSELELEYIICDGGSTDETLDIINSFTHPGIKVVSGPDSGMYEALSKGLALATGDITAYINAGDYYSPHAFEIVRDVFQENTEVRWLTGFIVKYNVFDHMIFCKSVFRYRRDLLLAGAYVYPFPYIQQESTFWASDLNEQIDLTTLSTFKLAGDYYLWYSFAKQCPLFSIDAYLGGFKIHDGQLSEGKDQYLTEVKSFTDSPGLKTQILKMVEKLLWKLPPGFTKSLSQGQKLAYDLEAQQWKLLK